MLLTTTQDLERVARALYRLTPDTRSEEPVTSEFSTVPPQRSETGSASASGNKAAPVTHDEEWFWEGNVQAAVVSHLAQQGWRIMRVASTSSSEHGIDIEASRDGSKIMVEVKGYPGTTYARGAQKGEAKSSPAATQARTYFSNALLAGLLMRSESAEDRVVLAFPDMATFASLAQRVSVPLAAAAIEVWMVSENGKVIEGAPA